MFLCRERLLPQKCRSKLGNDNSYGPIVRNSELSQTAFPLNGIKRRRLSTGGGGHDRSLSNCKFLFILSNQ